MSKYQPLWEAIQNDGRASFVLTFDEIEQLAGLPLDHSFLNFKKECLNYGYEVEKISLKNKEVHFIKHSNK